MADNPYVNKIEYVGQTLMDLTNDTATPSDVLIGATFHDRSGAPQQGNLGAFTGADASSSGSVGLVPAPSAGDQDKVLMGDGTWKNIIINNLSTDDSTKALSAAQGYELNRKMAPVIGTNKDWLTGKNLNDYNTTGIYYFSTSNTNNPPSIGWFTLIVIGGKSDVTTQIAYSQNGGYYIREYRSATWSNWYKYALESTVDNLSNTVGNLSNTVGNLSNTVGNLSNTVGNLSNTVDSLNNNLIKFTTHTVTMNFSAGNAGSRIGYDDGALPTGVTANNIIGIVCTSYSWSTNTAQPPVTIVNSSNDHISVYVFASTNTSTSSGNTATFRIAYKGV